MQEEKSFDSEIQVNPFEFSGNQEDFEMSQEDVMNDEGKKDDKSIKEERKIKSTKLR